MTIRSEHEIWGWHYSADCRAGNNNVLSKDAILEFGNALIQKIDMEAYGEPQIVHFGKEDKTGLTYSQLITTSNICGHFCDDSHDLYFDVFSCKPFDISVIEGLLVDRFGFESIKSRYFVRGRL